MAAQILDYRRRPPPSAPTSRLAVMALALSILVCPCLLPAMTGKLSSAFGWSRRVDKSILLAAHAVALALSVSAQIQLFRSRGRLRGAAYADFALMLSLLWVAVDLLLLMLVGH